MQSVKVLSLLVVVLVIAVEPQSASAAPRDVNQADREAVDRLVRAQVGSGRSADDQPVAEFPEARRYAVGTVGVATTYVAAQYVIETGNTWQLFLAVFDGRTHKVLAHGRIGGKGYREGRLEAVRRGVVVVTVKYYGDGDPMCCPSVLGESSFEVRDGELWEVDARVKSTGSKHP